MTAAEMVQKVRDAVTIPEALAIADEFVLEVVRETEDACDTAFEDACDTAFEDVAVQGDELASQFEEMVKSVHAEAKHPGYHKSCVEPICRDGWATVAHLKAL